MELATATLPAIQQIVTKVTTAANFPQVIIKIFSSADCAELRNIGLVYTTDKPGLKLLFKHDSRFDGTDLNHFDDKSGILSLDVTPKSGTALDEHIQHRIMSLVKLLIIYTVFQQGCEGKRSSFEMQKATQTNGDIRVYIRYKNQNKIHTATFQATYVGGKLEITYETKGYVTGMRTVHLCDTSNIPTVLSNLDDYIKSVSSNTASFQTLSRLDDHELWQTIGRLADVIDSHLYHA